MYCDTRHAEDNRFHPVILFHDYSYSKESKLHHVHIPYGDPYYRPLIQVKKERMNEMLRTNSKAWRYVIKHKEVPTAAGIASMATATTVIATAEPSPRLSTSSTSSSSSSASSRHHNSPSPAQPMTTVPFQHGHPQSLSQYSPDRYYAKRAAAAWYDRSGKDSVPSRKRRGNLPKSVTSILKQWLVDHCHHPYPTEEEKIHLRAKTGLTLNQISNWFINARRRILPLILVRLQQPGANAEDEEDEEEAEYRGKVPVKEQDAAATPKPRSCQRKRGMPKLST